MTKSRNVVGWFEIYVRDMARAKKFYEHTLQITLEGLPSDGMEMEMLAFPMPQTDDDCGGDFPGCPGALVKMDGMEPGGGGTLIYFTCEDCAVEEARVVEGGGRVFKPKFSIGDYGFISLIADTESNMIGLHSLK